MQTSNNNGNAAPPSLASRTRSSLPHIVSSTTTTRRQSQSAHAAARRKSSSATAARASASPYPAFVPLERVASTSGDGRARSVSNHPQGHPSTYVSPSFNASSVAFPSPYIDANSSTNASTSNPQLATGSQWIASYTHSRSSSISSISSLSSSSWSDVDSLRQNEEEEGRKDALGSGTMGPLDSIDTINLDALGPAMESEPPYTYPNLDMPNPFGSYQTASVGSNYSPQSSHPFLQSKPHTSPVEPSSYSPQSRHPFLQSRTILPEVTSVTPQNTAPPPTTDIDPLLVAHANAVKSAIGVNTTSEKAKIQFVHMWLNQSFVLHAEGNVSRQALYGLYIHICSQYGIFPMNAASYGKAVRSCWPGIKTRRLGIRGQSRYHYCGIRPATKAIDDLVNWVNTTDLGAPGGPMTSSGIAGAESASFAFLPSSNDLDAHDAGAYVFASPAKLEHPIPPATSASHTPSHSGSSASSLGFNNISLMPPVSRYSSFATSAGSSGCPSEVSDTSSVDGTDDDDGEGSPLETFSQQSPVEQQGLFNPFQANVPSVEPFDRLSVVDPSELGTGAIRMRRQFSAPAIPTIANLQHSDMDAAMGDLKTPTALQFLGTGKSSIEMVASGSGSGTETAMPGSGSSSDTTPEARLQHRYRQSIALASGSKGATTSPLMPLERRATVAELSITIPPPLVQSSVSTHRQEWSAPGNQRLPVTAHETMASTPSEFAYYMLPNQLHISLPSFEQVLQSTNVPGHAAALRGPSPTSPGNGLDRTASELLWNTYRSEHCQGILKLVGQGRWDDLEAFVLQFWNQLDAVQRDVVQHPILADALYRADAVVYNAILDYLTANVTSPFDKSMHSSLSRVATNLEQYIITALSAFPAEYISCRVELASRTGHLMSRFLGLTRLVESVDGILAQPGAIYDLCQAWQSIDFDMITNQAALVTKCTQDATSQYLADAQVALTKLRETATSGIITFANACISRALGPSHHHDTGTAHSDMREISRESTARQFILKWNYVSSQIARDLLIRGSPSAPHFQIISLLVEEWMCLVILKDITLQVGAVSASIEGEGLSATHRAGLVPDTSAFLVSPSAMGATSFDASLRPMTAPSCSGIPPPPLTALPSSNFNFAAALSPTTRAIFGDARTPIYLNFGHIPPLTPAFRQSFGTSGGGLQYSLDDFHLPLASPARLSVGHPAGR